MELPLYKYQGAEDLCLEFCRCPGLPNSTTNSQKGKQCWLSSDQLTPFRSRHEGSHRQQRPDLVRPPTPSYSDQGRTSNVDTVSVGSGGPLIFPGPDGFGRPKAGKWDLW